MPDASDIIARRKADALVTGATYSNKTHSLQGSITKRLLNLGRQSGGGVSGGGGGGGGPVVNNYPPVSSFNVNAPSADSFNVSWDYENTGPSDFSSFNIYGTSKADYETGNPTFDTIWTSVNIESTRSAIVPGIPGVNLSSGTDYVLRIIVYYDSGVSTPVDLDATTTSS